ncbi:mitotic spindle assembly checkpoint protein MAD1 [Ixodes scapularis]|uniref:mitotic spindle assembly checkpoint protein MAD1 n=1 Tax=Ixodes scapularis TaxID=6945 RepID=UPI001C3957CB|nr:mitotic spindle assembly checkpoint protein MAD1 [Ixodes scapularis]
MSFTCENTRVMRAIREFSDMFAVERSSDASTEDGTAVRHLDFSPNINGRRSDSLADIKPASVINAAEVDSLKAELLASKAEISRLTLELSQSEPARKVLLVCQAREVDELKESLQKETDKGHELKRQVVRLLEQEATLRAELSRLKQRTARQSADLQDQLRQSQAHCLDLQCQLDEKTELAENTRVTLKAEVHRLTMSQVSLSSSLQETREQLDLLMRRSGEKEAAITRLQDENADLRKLEARAKDLQRRLDELKEAESLARIMKEELKRLPCVEKELAQLQEEVKLHRRARANVQLVQEQMLSLKADAGRTEELQQTCSRQQLELEQLRHKLGLWQSLAGEPHRLGSPTAVLQCLADLRRSELALTERQSKLMAENETLRGKVDTMGQELRRANAKLVHLQTQADEQTAFTRRMQRRLLLQGKEREAYRALMDSYQSEAGQQWPAAAAKQIQSLEAVLADYRHSLDQVEKELEDLRNRRQLSSSCRSDAESQTDQVKFENSENGGASGLRIVHFVENPLEVAFRERLESVSRLEEENDRLRARVKVLEEFGCSQDVTAQVQLRLDQDGSLPDRKSLQDQLASAEAKNRRLVAAFRRTSQDFRQGCYLLTGYRVDVVKEGHYKLTHVYANSPDDYLLFQNGESSMNVLETDYLKRLSSLAEEYLAKHDSVPAFLSALTLELFAQRSTAQAATRQSLSST